MIFNSFQFLWLFPIIFGGYYGISWLIGRKEQGRISNILLLIISYALYLQWNPFALLVLLWVTLITYVGARLIETKDQKAKPIFVAALVLVLLPLILYKYSNFISENINAFLTSCLPLKITLPGLNWAIPIGISFYTFQAIGYLADVYKKQFKAEHDLLDYMLFVGFFPQILSGPINRASELLPQIKQKRTFNYEKAVQGMKWLIWGMFLKVVFADRLGFYVDSAYMQYLYMSGKTFFLASIMYTLQIYGDFAGYSLMAIGVGRLMGFDMINNFRRPYFAPSITEFWRRWHISLTRWLTTYVYISLGGNRCSKLRQYWNIMVTFLVSGLWHGANWTFVCWGLLHGLLQCIEKILGIDPKGKYAESSFLKYIYPVRIVVTFLLVNFAWILFRMPNLERAGLVLKRIFTWEGSDLFLPNHSTIGFMLLGIMLVFVKEFCEEFCPKIQLFDNRYMIVRWTSYLVVCIMILLCGVFDSSQFIYVKF